MRVAILCSSTVVWSWLTILIVGTSTSNRKHLMVQRDSFVKQRRANAGAIHECVFAIKQNNIQLLETELLYRSTPGSDMYQQWMTYEQVTALTANDNSARIVLETLMSIGGIDIVWESKRKDYMKASASILTWEKLFQTAFYEFLDLASSSHGENTRTTTSTAITTTLHLRALDLTIPDTLMKHVSCVFNTIQPPPVVHKHFVLQRPLVSSISSSSSAATLPFFKSSSSASSSTLSSSRRRSSPSVDDAAATSPSISSNILNSDAKKLMDQYVTPSFLNTLYSVPNNTGSISLRQAVFETNGQHFSPSDLRDFQKTFKLPLSPAMDISGGQYEASKCSQTQYYGAVTDDADAAQCWEGNLDVQYLSAIAQSVSTIYWYVGGADPFLEWILDVANETNPPQVNSISWGTTEQDYSPDSMTQFNTEAMKLSLIGVTIVVSSADNGAHGNACECSRSSASSSSPFWQGGNNSWSGYGYFPSFPATSPYVTSVGATQGPEVGSPEVGCQSDEGGVITSGGGFSTLFERPEWQFDQVDSYLNGLLINASSFTAPSTSSSKSGSVEGRPKEGYNKLGRGYPDIALIAVKYAVMIDGTLFYVFGTSAAAPVFAGFISLINSRRLALNMSLVGYINPTLYQSANAARFNDVVHGNNKCCLNADYATQDTICCDSGFSATDGWDPMTGLGSVSYLNLASMFDAEAPTPRPTTRPHNDNGAAFIAFLNVVGMKELRTDNQKVATFCVIMFILCCSLIISIYLCYHYPQECFDSLAYCSCCCSGCSWCCIAQYSLTDTEKRQLEEQRDYTVVDDVATATMQLPHSTSPTTITSITTGAGYRSKTIDRNGSDVAAPASPPRSLLGASRSRKGQKKEDIADNENTSPYLYPHQSSKRNTTNAYSNNMQQSTIEFSELNPMSHFMHSPPSSSSRAGVGPPPNLRLVNHPSYADSTSEAVELFPSAVTVASTSGKSSYPMMPRIAGASRTHTTEASFLNQSNLSPYRVSSPPSPPPPPAPPYLLMMQQQTDIRQHEEEGRISIATEAANARTHRYALHTAPFATAVYPSLMTTVPINSSNNRYNNYGRSSSSSNDNNRSDSDDGFEDIIYMTETQDVPATHQAAITFVAANSSPSSGWTEISSVVHFANNGCTQPLQIMRPPPQSSPPLLPTSTLHSQQAGNAAGDHTTRVISAAAISTAPSALSTDLAKQVLAWKARSSSSAAVASTIPSANQEDSSGSHTPGSRPGAKLWPSWNTVANKSPSWSAAMVYSQANHVFAASSSSGDTNGDYGRGDNGSSRKARNGFRMSSRGESGGGSRTSNDRPLSLRGSSSSRSAGNDETIVLKRHSVAAVAIRTDSGDDGGGVGEERYGVTTISSPNKRPPPPPPPSRPPPPPPPLLNKIPSQLPSLLLLPAEPISNKSSPDKRKSRRSVTFKDEES